MSRFCCARVPPSDIRAPGRVHARFRCLKAPSRVAVAHGAHSGLMGPPVGLIIRQKEPHNLETPFDQVRSFLTPTELFYIRSHFATPKVEVASYQLRIDGAVRNPFSLTYQELRDMPSETRVAVLECAGNSRVFL